MDAFRLLSEKTINRSEQETGINPSTGNLWIHQVDVVGRRYLNEGTRIYRTASPPLLFCPGPRITISQWNGSIYRFCLWSLLGFYFLIILPSVNLVVLLYFQCPFVIVCSVRKVRGVSAFGLVNQLNGAYSRVHKVLFSASNSLQFQNSPLKRWML